MHATAVLAGRRDRTVGRTRRSRPTASPRRSVSGTRVAVQVQRRRGEKRGGGGGHCSLARADGGVHPVPESLRVCALLVGSRSLSCMGYSTRFRAVVRPSSHTRVEHCKTPRTDCALGVRVRMNVRACVRCDTCIRRAYALRVCIRVCARARVRVPTCVGVCLCAWLCALYVRWRVFPRDRRMRALCCVTSHRSRHVV
jgi:hypothetical protein